VATALVGYGFKEICSSSSSAVNFLTQFFGFSEVLAF
jgi:hypothetical protein